MSKEILKTSSKINKVNVDHLKSKIIIKEKKKKLQSKIIYLSVIASVGVLGFFVS